MFNCLTIALSSNVKSQQNLTDWAALSVVALFALVGCDNTGPPVNRQAAAPPFTTSVHQQIDALQRKNRTLESNLEELQSENERLKRKIGVLSERPRVFPRPPINVDRVGFNQRNVNQLEPGIPESDVRRMFGEPSSIEITTFGNESPGGPWSGKVWRYRTRGAYISEQNTVVFSRADQGWIVNHFEIFNIE